MAPYASTLESGAVTTNGTYAYVAGGNNSGIALNLFNRYDPVLNTWTALAPLPQALYDARSTYSPVNNKIYVFGGINSQATSSIPTMCTT